MRKILFIGVLALVMAAIPSSTYAGHQPARKFSAALAGTHELPPNGSTATGSVSLHVIRHDSTVRYRLEIEDIQNVFVAHIHLGTVTENGPVVVFLYGPVSPPVSGEVSVNGTFTASNFVGPLQGKRMSQLLAAMRTGGTYVNAHTTLHPGGEIRGQVVVDGDEGD